uniref:Hexosyltransferase n=1 Tax=Ciona savignyi TaxID=51511 RepID=H2YY67_CIOSA
MNKHLYHVIRRRNKVLVFVLVALWAPFLYHRLRPSRSKATSVLPSDNYFEKQLKEIPHLYLEENLVSSQYEYTYVILPRHAAACGVSQSHYVMKDRSKRETNNSTDFPVPNLNKIGQQRTLPLIMLFLVHSGASHFEHRRAIRETWGSVGKRLSRLVFILGNPHNYTTQQQVDTESSVHGDILQVDFYETYRNITLKAIMALKWVTRYCPRAAYVTKVDDDMFVGVERILSSAVGGGMDRRRLLLCKPNHDFKVTRDGKYQVPVSLYNATRWPTFCFGGCWIASIDIIKKFYEEAMKTKQIYLDDVFITGILRLKIHLRLRRVRFSTNIFCHGRGDPENVRKFWKQRTENFSVNPRKHWMSCYR